MPADPAAHLVVTLASGAADALSGRYLDVETDDVAALVARAEEIRQRNLLTLRIATAVLDAMLLSQVNLWPEGGSLQQACHWRQTRRTRCRLRARRASRAVRPACCRRAR